MGPMGRMVGHEQPAAAAREMQNAKCKMQNEKKGVLFVSFFAFCILHFAFCILHPITAHRPPR
ncbi:MAG TPA: hypothetical protein VEK57_02175, partial [Thermoanaerobaculia bacterium]|nr:hypothetical protein [Thermoanaerobaculia bacterium]